MKNLPVNSLNFEDIKSNFKEFLKGNQLYKDFNFEASGISTLLNTMSYQTHYIGYFVKMLLDEAFSDSAHTRQALLSHAKRNSYIPKGRACARAEVVLKVVTTLANEPSSRMVEVVRGDKFNSTNTTQDKRVFNVLDGSAIYSRTVVGSNVTYTSDVLTVYEGTLRTWNFLVDNSVLNQHFIVRDANMDIDTIRVRVRANENSSESTDFMLMTDIADLSPESNAFMVTTDADGFYQIFFGGGVFGVEPETGNAIEVTYISTNGDSGNGAKDFTFVPLTPSSYTYTVLSENVSSGGAEPQTLEELRFAIPNHVRRQNRIVTALDGRTFLLDTYRNIDSINVWGGETNPTRDYGKLYVSIKPKFADKLTNLAKTQIRQSIVKKGWSGIDVVFQDPDFINTDLSLYVTLDLRKSNKTQQEIFNDISARVTQYNLEQLSKFDNMLSDLNLLTYLKATDVAVKSIYSKKIISKDHAHLHGTTASNIVNFSNAISARTVKSSSITYGGTAYYLKDDGEGKMLLVKTSNNVAITRPVGTVDYVKGIITYTLPSSARVTNYEESSFGVLTLSLTPANPDINTAQNNIVRITATKVLPQ